MIPEQSITQSVEYVRRNGANGYLSCLWAGSWLKLRALHTSCQAADSRARTLKELHNTVQSLTACASPARLAAEMPLNVKVCHPGSQAAVLQIRESAFAGELTNKYAELSTLQTSCQIHCCVQWEQVTLCRCWNPSAHRTQATRETASILR